MRTEKITGKGSFHAVETKNRRRISDIFKAKPFLL